MIVVDASALADLLLNQESAPRIAARLFETQEPLCVPHLILIELASVVRRLFLEGKVSEQRAAQFFDDLRDLPLVTYPHDVLLPRVWELRHNLSAYDAAYIALAEMLPATLVTTDAPLSRSAGHTAKIEFVARTAAA